MDLSLTKTLVPEAFPSRRSVVQTAAVAGVAALTAKWTGVVAVAPPPVVVTATKGPGVSSGYRITDHVLRYYEVART